jgi:uncharacterized membrane protein
MNNPPLPFAGPTNVDVPSRQIELFIAQLLRLGVIVSFAIVCLGIALVVITGRTGYQSIQLDDLNSIVRYQPGMSEYPNTVNDVMAGIAAFKPYALISLGLLILIAIPVMRVAISVAAFFVERDWTYVFITAFVLAMLILSFLFGAAGG